MSATTATAPAAPAAPPARSRRLVLVVAVVVLAGVLASVGYAVFLRTEDADAASAAEAAPVEGAVVEVGTLTTNLAGAAGRYARVGIAVVLAEGADTAAVEARFALVKDAAIGEIGRHDAAALAAADGTERLRAGLAERIRELYPDGEVLRVVLTELLIQ